jgi:hypothetical protein
MRLSKYYQINSIASNPFHPFDQINRMGRLAREDARNRKARRRRKSEPAARKPNTSQTFKKVPTDSGRRPATDE